MITIKPFCAIRPKKQYVDQVAALPYDVVSVEEAREAIRKNPYSFLNVDKPEARAKDGETQENMPKEAKNYLEWMIREGVYEEEAEETFYLYGLEGDGRSQYGVVGCFWYQDYEEGRIKKHENTRKDKEEERILHVEACKAHTGPIFMAYKQSMRLEQFIENYQENKLPLYSFEDEYGLKQVIYQIDKKDNATIKEAFEQLDSLYIADGHHRAAAACSYAKSQNRESGEKDYFLGVAFPKDSLYIMDYNRVIHLEKELDEKVFFEALAKNFTVVPIDEITFKPMRQHEFGMRYRGKWYALQVKEAFIQDDPIKALDVAILQDYVLEPLFEIKEPRTDKRIEFVGGIRGIEMLNEMTKEPQQIAFSLYPTSFDEIIAVADQGGLMPPKSTWFEPKLRSGIFIHRI